MSKYLSYDHKQMLFSVCGIWGAKKSELKLIEPKLKKAFTNLEKLRTTDEQGFFNLPYQRKGVKKVLEHAEIVKNKFKHLVVIGIGGSDLGARTIYESLGAESSGVMLHFLSNPDPEVIADWAKKDPYWKKTAIVVISKSGSTLETMSIFMTLRGALIKTVGKAKHAKHVYVITDPKGGILQGIAEKEGYTIIPHPLNVGGRFAVLSTVGLFPAACAGIDIKRMLAGAASVEREHRKLEGKSDPARFAALHYLAYTKRKQHIHIAMPYAQHLKQFGMWYRQIWAESLGKKKGKGPLHIGPTPVASLGSVDQHSQIQLYNQGLADKVLTFITVKKFRAEVRVPNVWGRVEGIDYIGGHSFADIMKAEVDGTEYALAKAKVPTGRLIIPEISPESLGALFMFYEIAVAYMAELFGINAFNQPGVESGKIKAKELLKAKRR